MIYCKNFCSRYHLTKINKFYSQNYSHTSNFIAFIAYRAKVYELEVEVRSKKTVQFRKKARILEKIAYCDKCLNEGADNELQLLNLLTSSYAIMIKTDFNR